MAAARAADGAIERTKGVFVYSCKTATLGVFVSVVKTTPKWFGSCEKQQHVGAFGFVKRAARPTPHKGAFGSQLPTRIFGFYLGQQLRLRWLDGSVQVSTKWASWLAAKTAMVAIGSFITHKAPRVKWFVIADKNSVSGYLDSKRFALVFLAPRNRMRLVVLDSHKGRLVWVNIEGTIGTAEHKGCDWSYEDDEDDEDEDDNEDGWDVDDEWLMAPVTPPLMPVVPPPSTFKVGGPSTAAPGLPFPVGRLLSGEQCCGTSQGDW
ncbi:hypothetical protein Tco_0696309 [Tanacetum coccineum]